MVVERWAQVIDGVVHNVVLWDGVIYHPIDAPRGWTPPAEGSMVVLRDGDETWVGPGHLHNGQRFSRSQHWPSHLPTINPSDGSIPGQLLMKGHPDVPDWVVAHADRVRGAQDAASRRQIIHDMLKRGPQA